ncbi:MAG: CHAP domain-containing protein [Clostridiales bacterium]|nr:CHAP domain-containing protein [Clostridiales bacterium]
MENNQQPNMIKTATDVGKTAVEAAKAGAKLASGNVAGAAADAVKSEGLRKIILGSVAAFSMVIILVANSISSVLFYPLQTAESVWENVTTSVVEFFSGVKSTVVSGIYEMFGWETQDDTEDNTAGIDEDSLGFMEDETSMKNTVSKMILRTSKLYSARHKELLDEIETDFQLKRSLNSGITVTKTIIDPVGNKTTTDLEALKILCLYAVQTDCDIQGMNLNDYTKWVGSKKFFADKESGPAGWDTQITKWKGTFLPQPEYDEAAKAKEDGTYNESDYDYSSALAEILKHEECTSNVVTDSATGQTIGINYIYTISSTSIDNICDDVIKFSQSSDGSELSAISPAKYRKDHYTDMVQYMQEYFNISNTTTYSGISGNGSSIVQVALQEVGYLEKASADEAYFDDKTANAGFGNYTKYGKWYGLNGEYWCAIFVSWCANECGFIESGIIPKSASCIDVWNWFAEKGLAHLSSDTSYEPKPGDLCLVGPGDHIGIVEKYENGTLWTIEGNTSGQSDTIVANGGGVFEKQYSNPAQRWYGYCSPEYPAPAVGSIANAIVLPSGLGRVHSVTYWDTTPWVYNQHKLVQLMGTENKTYGGNVTKNAKNFTCYGQWYAAAMTSTFGDIGQMVFCIQDNNTCYPVIIADEASQVEFDNGSYSDHNPANKWGHDNGTCVIEFEVALAMKFMSGFTGSTNSIEPLFDHYITQVVPVTNVFNNSTYLNNVEQAYRDCGLEEAGISLITTSGNVIEPKAVPTATAAPSAAPSK